jgi:hypothetical protein
MRDLETELFIWDAEPAAMKAEPIAKGTRIEIPMVFLEGVHFETVAADDCTLIEAVRAAEVAVIEQMDNDGLSIRDGMYLEQVFIEPGLLILGLGT